MFNRKAYKQIAKKQLKGRWMTPVLMTLFVMGVGYLLQAPEHIDAIKRFISSASNFGDHFKFNKFSNGNGFSQSFMFNFGSVPKIKSSRDPILLLISLLLTGVFTIAEYYVYIILSHTTEKQSFNTFIKGFSLWAKGLLGWLWSALWIFLWSCLLIVPGIIKAISYSQIFFILTEYPEIGVRKAMKLSMKMTNGYKGDLFVMALSFFGWMIVASLTYGIGYLWLLPYFNMSFTNAYHALKANALQSGTLTQSDFTVTQNI